MVWTDGRMDGMMDRSNERRAEPKISAVPTTIVARSPREEREGEGKETFSICACAWAGRKRKEEKMRVKIISENGKILLLKLEIGLVK